MLGRTSDSRRISFPGVGYVNIQLKLIAIGIKDVEAVGDGVIRYANDRHPGGLELFFRFSEFFVGVANFETDVIEARFWYMLRSGSTTDADEEKLVMRPAGREERRSAHVTFDLGEAEDITIKFA